MLQGWVVSGENPEGAGWMLKGEFVCYPCMKWFYRWAISSVMGLYALQLEAVLAEAPDSGAV